MDLTLPSPNSPDYTPTLIYKARAHLALDNPEAALSLIPESENVALKAVSALARYVGAAKDAETQAAEAALEELRDLCVEIEGDDAEASEKEKGTVRVLAGTAFVLAGELEEALETLGASANTENLEACVLILHHLRILTFLVQCRAHRADLPLHPPPRPRA